MECADPTDAQLELITDDPRVRKKTKTVFQEWKEFREVGKEVGGLISRSQAAVILGVTNQQVGSWVTRGRLSRWIFLGVNFVSSAEVLALYKERARGEISVGGRGKKAPNLAEVAKAAYSDMADSLD